MDTKEYFENLETIEQDKIHPEFHTFATVWLKSRCPQQYKELVSRYKSIEGEIYAQHECNANKVPF